MITDEDIEHWRTRLLDVYPDAGTCPGLDSDVLYLLDVTMRRFSAYESSRPALMAACQEIILRWENQRVEQAEMDAYYDALYEEERKKQETNHV